MYVQRDTLADVFENFKIMSLKIYELNPVKFQSNPSRLAKKN